VILSLIPKRAPTLYIASQVSLTKHDGTDRTLNHRCANDKEYFEDKKYFDIFAMQINRYVVAF